MLLAEKEVRVDFAAKLTHPIGSGMPFLQRVRFCFHAVPLRP